MSDFKVRPPGRPRQSPVDGQERTASADGGEKTFELTREASAAKEVTSTEAADPATLVQQLRDGQLDIEQALEIMIDQALRAGPVAATSEGLRREIRQALLELVQDDPTLASLASAMKR